MDTPREMLESLFPLDIFAIDFDKLVANEVEKFDIELYNDFLAKYILLTKESSLKTHNMKRYFNDKAVFIKNEIYPLKKNNVKGLTYQQQISVKFNAFKNVYFQQGRVYDRDRESINEMYEVILEHYNNFLKYIGDIIFIHDEILFLASGPDFKYKLIHRPLMTTLNKQLSESHRSSKFFLDLLLLKDEISDKSNLLYEINKFNQKLDSFYEIISWKVLFLELLRIVEINYKSIDNLKIKFQINDFPHQQIFLNIRGTKIYENFIFNINQKKSTNCFSFIFNAMKNDGLIAKEFRNPDYIAWVERIFKFKMSRVIDLKDIKTEKYMAQYEKSKDLFNGNIYL